MTIRQIPGGRTLRRSALLIAVIVQMTVIAGCGSKDKGPQRYKLSGTVTYEGKPIPKGFIEFIPDTSKGNEGPGSGAKIVDGKYETDKGTVGGPHIVKISGTDGVPYTEEGEEVEAGKELFPLYETTMDLPKQDDTLDITVPKGGGKQTTKTQ